MNQILSKHGITILDKRMPENNITMVNPKKLLGFTITNKTEEHLFIEIEFNSHGISEIIIRK